MKLLFKTYQLNKSTIMKKFSLLLSLFLGAHSAWAHDAEVDGIFYNLFEGSQCATVTFQGDA